MRLSTVRSRQPRCPPDCQRRGGGSREGMIRYDAIVAGGIDLQFAGWGSPASATSTRARAGATTHRHVCVGQHAAPTARALRPPPAGMSFYRRALDGDDHSPREADRAVGHRRVKPGASRGWAKVAPCSAASVVPPAWTPGVWLDRASGGAGSAALNRRRPSRAASSDSEQLFQPLFDVSADGRGPHAWARSCAQCAFRMRSPSITIAA